MNEFLFNNPEIVTVTHYLDVDQVTGFSESRPAYSHPTIPIELITLTHKEAIHPEGLLILVPPFMQTISDIVNHDFQSQLIANFVSQNWRVAVYQDAGILGVNPYSRLNRYTFAFLTNW